MLNGLDLFSGIGGLGIALAPWVRTVAYCENDRYAQSVLLARMADGTLVNAPIWDDVRTLERKLLPQIDMVYGGFPCQDISENLPGSGLEGERSGLFWEIHRLAEEIKPTFIFLENVRNIRSKGLGQIARALADSGYDLRWDIVPAYANTQMFEGERWFCLAKAIGERSEERRIECESAPGEPWNIDSIPTPVWGEDAGELARVDDGIPVWTHRVRTLGNAVVPHQARTAFERLMGLK